MRMWWGRLKHIGAALAVLATAAAVALTLTPAASAPLLAQFRNVNPKVWLSDLNWERAHAGRVPLVTEGLPVRDAALDGAPLRIGGVPYYRGLGVGGGSEVVYALRGHYVRFEAVAGLQDDAWGEDPSLRFFVFLDDVLAFDSGVLRRGDAPQQVDLPVTGVQELRLATSGIEGHGAWAGATLAVPDAQQVTDAAATLQARLRAERERRAEARVSHTLELSAIAAIERLRLGLMLGGTVKQDAGVVRVISAPGRLTLANGRTSATLGTGGGEQARLTVLDLSTNRLLLHRATPTVALASGEYYRLHEQRAAAPDDVQTRPIDEPGFGPGKELRARFRSADGLLTFWITLQLFDDHPALLYQTGVEGAATSERAAFLLLDAAEGSSVAVGERPQYLTDYNRLRLGALPDDGLLREERIGNSKPVWLWNAEDGSGLLLAAIDDTATSPFLTLRREPGAAAAQISFGAEQARQYEGLVSPRLYIEATYTAHLHEAFAPFRGAMAALYPTLPLPEWVQHQWLSWYVYYFDINEDLLRQQVDYIADHLAGAGEWHLLVDAGWYVGEGRPDAEWRNVDRVKFQDGLRAFVDYAHQRGVRIVLYFGAPYLNTQEASGNWMGLTGLARQYPEWLIFTSADELAEHYLMDFAQPGLRAYVGDVMGDFYRDYGVDGMKIDGLASSEGELPAQEAGASWLLDRRAAAQTMDIYRFLHESANAVAPAPYIESGWSTPLFAHPYSHTFRFGDESTAFSNPYPMGGLVEHIDYAAYQAALGQPANMGAIYGDPNISAVPRWWLEAALAMGNQIALGFDLTLLEPGPRDHFRALLAHYRPFTGQTTFDGKLAPEVFATTSGPLTYAGVLNRAADARRFELDLVEYGMAAETATGYDVEADRFFTVRDGQAVVDTEAESFGLLILRTTPGVLWTSSGFTEELHGDAVTVMLRGPRDDAGLVQLATPEPLYVALDGEALEPAESATPGPSRFSWDAATGVLSVGLPPGDERTLAVRWSEGGGAE